MKIFKDPKNLLTYSLAFSSIIIAIAFAFGKYTLYMEFELNKRQHALDVFEEVMDCLDEYNDESAVSCGERARSFLLDKESVWPDLNDEQD